MRGSWSSHQAPGPRDCDTERTPPFLVTAHPTFANCLAHSCDRKCTVLRRVIIRGYLVSNASHRISGVYSLPGDKTPMAGKITFDTVRKIASAFPGVEESTTYGAPSLKIGGTLLTCMAINKSAEPNSLVLRIDTDQRDALIAEAPDTFYVTDHYVNYPCVLVRLSRVKAGVLRDLLHASWKFVSANATRKRRPLSR